MKLLVDENLPPRLAVELADLFPLSTHVREVGLGGTEDSLLWEFAKNAGYAFLTKDKDFANLSIARGFPPKVVLLQTGNCSSSEVASLLRGNAIRLTDFDEDPQRGLLILR